MADAGFFQIEIYDVDAINGNGANSSLELLSFDCIQNNNNIFFPEYYPTVVYQTSSVKANNVPKPVLIRGRGPSLGTGYISDPAIDIKWDNGNFDVQNNDWGSFYNPGLISGSPYPLSNIHESAYFYFATGGMQQTVTLLQTGTSSGQKRAVLDVYSLTGSPYWIPQNIFQPTGSANQDAWVSYNCSSGMLSQKAIGYSISVLNQSSGITGDYTSKQFSGSNLTYSGYIQSGYCTLLSLLLASTGSFCLSPPPHTDEAGNPTPVQICLPSGLNSGQIVADIAQIVQQYAAQKSLQGQQQGQNTTNEIDNNSVALSYQNFSGNIIFNKPISGDYITFDAYNILGGYTGAYESIFNNPPPYNDVGLKWSFGIDYTGIDSLVSKINTDLYTTSYWLWMNYPCLTNSSSGYFEFGPLLKAVKLDSNTIGIQSTRFDSAGNYSINLFNANRSTTTALNVVKYMVPGSVKFQASNDNTNWVTLDAHNNIDWTKILPAYSKITSGINISDVSGAQNFIPNQNIGPEIKVTGGPVINVLYSAVASGIDTCGNPFSQQIDFYQLPSGVGSCTGATPTGGDNNINVGTFGGAFLSGDIVKSDYLKTGWKFFNNTGYNFYRLYFSQFQSNSQGWTSQYANEFEIDNINIYGIVTGYYANTGNMCLIGANYSNQIQGITTGYITGTAGGYASAATSGIFDFDNVLFTGVPNGNGSTRFQKASGKAVGPFTGILNQELIGTGFYTEQIGGYFYDVATQSIIFSEPVSGYINGSGNLSGGPYNVISPIFIQTGVTGVQRVISSQNVIVSGSVPNFLFTQINVPSFSYVTGVITGLVTGNSGSLLFQSDIALVPSFAYSYDISSTTQAVGILQLNIPSLGDQIRINNIPITYQTGSGFFPPAYFSDINSLNNTINTYSGAFQVTSSITNPVNLFLTAIPLGASGNSIPVQSFPASGGTGCPTFYSGQLFNGQTFYYTLTPEGAYVGHVNQTLYATGFYTGIGTGTMSGIIKNLLFVRHFSGVWDIRTGNLDYCDNGWITGDNTYTTNGFIPNPNYSGDLNAIPITIIYRNSPLVNSIDIATLSITGADFPSGVNLLLSGAF